MRELWSSSGSSEVASMNCKSVFRTLFLGLVAAFAAASPASAGVLYQTSYESPEYGADPLNGQEGWVNSFGIDPLVTSSFARTGSQSLEVRQDDGQAPFGLTIRPGPYTTSAPKVSVKHSVYVDGSDPWDFISPLALGGDNGFIAQLAIVDGLVAELGATNPGGAPSVPIATDTWIDLELILDFPTQTVEGFVNGQSIGSGQFSNPSSQLTQVEIFHIYDFGSTGPSGSFFVDDLSISAVPEPATLAAFLGLGLVGVGPMRSRKRRKATESMGDSALYRGGWKNDSKSTSLKSRVSRDLGDASRSI